MQVRQWTLRSWMTRFGAHFARLLELHREVAKALRPRGEQPAHIGIVHFRRVLLFVVS